MSEYIICSNMRVESEDVKLKLWGCRKTGKLCVGYSKRADVYVNDVPETSLNKGKMASCLDYTGGSREKDLFEEKTKEMVKREKELKKLLEGVDPNWKVCEKMRIGENWFECAIGKACVGDCSSSGHDEIWERSYNEGIAERCPRYVESEDEKNQAKRLLKELEKLEEEISKLAAKDEEAIKRLIKG